jgi:hypothetical protein
VGECAKCGRPAAVALQAGGGVREELDVSYCTPKHAHPLVCGRCGRRQQPTGTHGRSVEYRASDWGYCIRCRHNVCERCTAMQPGWTWRRCAACQEQLETFRGGLQDNPRPKFVGCLGIITLLAVLGAAACAVGTS